MDLDYGHTMLIWLNLHGTYKNIIVLPCSEYLGYTIVTMSVHNIAISSRNGKAFA